MTVVDREQAELDALLEVEGRLASPADFAVWASGGRWVAHRHLVVISDEVVGMVVDDTCDVLIVEVPVRHGKSELCSKWTPAWFMCQFPDQPVLLTSYEADFASGWGRKARDVVEEFGGGFGVRVSQRSSAADRWEIVGHGGGMRTAGAGGPLTGKGGALLVVDDPIKNDEEAFSQGARDKLWEWFQHTFLTRRQGIGKVVIVMSRWHHDDLVGRLSEDDLGLRIRTVHLPAEAEEGDPLGREVGEPLCPELVSVDKLAVAKRTSAWGSLYQQRPIAAEGALFAAEGFGRFRALEQDAGGERRRVFVLNGETGEKVWSEGECHRFATVDLAVSQKTWADWTVVASWAVTPDAELLCLGVVRVRVEAAGHLELVRRAIDAHNLGWVGVERQTFGLSLIQQARRQGFPIRELKADKDKVSRARPAQAMVEGRRVFLAAGAPWVDGFVRECVEFPLGRHDDQVDCLAYAANEVARGAVKGRVNKKVQLETSDDRAWRRMHDRLDGRSKRRHPVLGRL